MKNKELSFYLLLFLGLFLSTACSPKLVNQSDKVEKETHSIEILVQRLDSLNSHFPTDFYGKSNTSYTDNSNNQSFKASFRMKTDTAITALFTYAGIPIIQAILTEDSLKFQNKRSKCYVDLALQNFIRELPLDYHNFTQLLLGLPIGFEKELEFHQLPDKDYFVVATQKKRLSEQEYVADDAITFKYFLSDRGTVLERIEIESPKDKTKVLIKYSKRDLSTDFHLPQYINAKLMTINNEINLTLDFTKVEVDQIQEINYNVPANYAECE